MGGKKATFLVYFENKKPIKVTEEYHLPLMPNHGFANIPYYSAYILERHEEIINIKEFYKYICVNILAYVNIYVPHNGSVAHTQNIPYIHFRYQRL